MKYLISKHEIEFEHQTNLHKNREAYSPESNERNIKYTVSDEKKVFKKENGQKKLNKKKIF